MSGIASHFISEMLNYLRNESVAGATVLHAVAGFTGRQRVETTHLVDVAGNCRSS